MSPRSIRRASERKARKIQRKQERLAATTTVPPLEEEFSPEFIAEARATRERIRDGAMRDRVARLDEPAVLSAAKTQHRNEINRANAAHSTGPATPAGKLASSRNSLKHGLASGTLIIPGEDQTAFEALLQELLADHQPASTTEEMLVHEMAQSWWLTQRALRLQNDCFTAEGVDEKRLALFLRYQTTHERAFHKALNTLIRLQKERRKVGNGFVSQDRPTAAAQIRFVSQNRVEPEKPSPHPALETSETEELVSQAA